MPSVLDGQVSSPIDVSAIPGCRLWIDGVGCWLLWFDDRISIGNAMPSNEQKWPIQADLRTNHLTVSRSHGEYVVESTGTTTINHEEIQRKTFLNARDALGLGEDVQITFDIPSPLSNSAVIQLESGHRTTDHTDGIVMFDQTCLLGEGSQAHLPCRGWSETVILYQRDRVLWWKAHRANSEGQPVEENEVLTGKDWSFRLEAIR